MTSRLLGEASSSSSADLWREGAALSRRAQVRGIPGSGCQHSDTPMSAAEPAQHRRRQSRLLGARFVRRKHASLSRGQAKTFRCTFYQPETFLASAVNSGHEQRARRGVSKPPGGYDEITKRRGPRKQSSGVRIRYVDEDNRSGGTAEQLIRMGPVSVRRVEQGTMEEDGHAPAPPGDPG